VRILRSGSRSENLVDLPLKGPPDGHPAQPEKVVLVDLRDVGQRPAFVLPPFHDTVAVARVGSRHWPAELAVVAGPTFRVAEDVPRLVDADHLANVAAEVGVMPPSQLTIGAPDGGRIGVGLDTQNGVQGRQWKILQSAGFRGDDGGENLRRAW
jgi:hypothetical protein